MENWVKARHDCTTFQMLTKLRFGAEDDVKTRNELRQDHENVKFSIVNDGLKFAVLREGRSSSVSVVFEASGSAILVYGQVVEAHQQARTLNPLHATLTLTDEGECKIKVDDKELECWQFRRKVLEDLFFNF
jgi:hypothetical protein